MIEVGLTIVGGGVVGCATAAAAAATGLQVVLLEKEAQLALGTTSRNSEVAHGGMYYPVGSLKARCCVRGRRMLKEFCERAGVGWRGVGKLIVSVDAAEEPELRRLLQLGLDNGVEGLRMIDREELRGLEPQIEATAALLSPETAIFSAEGAARAYGRLAAERGAEIMCGAEVKRLERDGDGWLVTVGGRSEEWTHHSRLVVNAAGLSADRVAAMAGVPAGDFPEQVWVKGNYFGISPVHNDRVRHLVYPVPPVDASSLGMHLCLDLAGQMRLGPDVEPLAGGDDRRENYAVDPARGAAFFDGASRFLPWLGPDDLTPAMAGLRPKLAVTGFHDFHLRREAGDCEGMINLIGIDSPGLTSAPALADEVVALLRD